MAIDTVATLVSLVDAWAEDALEATEEAGLTNFCESIETYERPRRMAKSAELSLMLQPDYAAKDMYYCERAWGVVLSVDIRDSTARAMEVGAKNTLVAMHVYMRAMIRLVTNGGGTVVGLRGDGLIAAFGRKAVGEGKPLVTSEESDKAIGDSASCGDAMVRAVNRVVNPALVRRSIPAGLVIGVGVECGDLVVTKIGLPNAYDVTAYGNCVNRAAKISSEQRNKNKVLIGTTANQVWRRETGGRVSISPFGTGMFLVEYPADYPTLA